MSAEQNKTIIRRWVEGFNANNVNRLEALADELYSADFIVHNDAEPAATIGREGVKRFVRNALENTPDMQLTIRELLAEGDQAASRLTMSGTSASTGQPVRLMIIQMWRFVGSQIAELWQITIPAQRVS